MPRLLGLRQQLGRLAVEAAQLKRSNYTGYIFGCIVCALPTWLALKPAMLAHMQMLHSGACDQEPRVPRVWSSAVAATADQ